MNKNISCDTSVLINFLRIKRTDLLGKCPHSFFITDHVEAEVADYFIEQRACLEDALEQKILQRTTVAASEEFNLFAELIKTQQLGAGECAAIAIASHRNYSLAIDDRQAIRKASPLLLPNAILRTQDLILLMIQEGSLTMEEADRLLHSWATEHNFKLKIHSFKELLSSQEKEERNFLSVSQTLTQNPK